MKKVKVIPKSKKAKNKLINQMGSNPVCIVEQAKENGLLFLVSEHNRGTFMWVNTSNDENWEIY